MRYRFVKWVPIVLFFVLTLSQLAISYNTGVRYKYRIEIGKYLERVSDESNVLILEPAGQIPFFSKLKTVDTVGLTSPLAIKYQRIHGKNYLGYMLNEIKPTWVIVLNPIKEVLPDIDNFDKLKDIGLVEHFKYVPSEFSTGLILKLANYGTVGDDLYLYKIN